MIRYVLRVECYYDKSIYATIEIDENKTLAALSKLILTAFDFDDDHMYMFSLNRKRYDKSGFYSPGAGCGRSAAGVKLESLQLNVRKKIIFLYDFGNEWLFEITVKKKIDTDKKTKSQITDVVGKLNQYPDYEDIFEGEFEDEIEDKIEKEFEEDKCEKKALSPLQASEITALNYDDTDVDFTGGKTYLGESVVILDDPCTIQDMLNEADLDDLKDIMKKMGDEKNIPEKRQECIQLISEGYHDQSLFLRIMTPKMLYLLLKIANREEVNCQYIWKNEYTFFQLIYLRLIWGEDTEDMEILLTIPEDLPAVVASIVSDKIKISNDCNIQIYIENLMQVYGVIELTELDKILQISFNQPSQVQYLTDNVISQLTLWNLLHVYKKQNGIWLSIYDESQTDEVIKARVAFKVKKYRELSVEDILAIKNDDFYSIISQSMKLFKRLSSQRQLSETDLEDFMMKFISYCAMGMKKQDFYKIIEKEIKYIKIFSEYTMKLLENARKQYPAAVLGGHSFGYYEELINDGYKQMSLFEEELPF